jgi:hypothetical protein
MAFRPFACRLLALVAVGMPAGPSMAFGAGQLAARGDALVSHAAHYDMSLASVRSAAGIVGAAGSMAYTFTQGCEGWTVETRTDLALAQTQGETVNSSWEFVSWETRDGQSYRFRVRNTRNGVVQETYDGEATLDGTAGGTAVFHGPGADDQTFDLPPGTMFPTAHTLALIETARAGRRFLSAPVFDGSAVQGAFQVSAAIGAGQRAPEPTAHDTGTLDRGTLDTGALLRGDSWPMTLAFFSDPAGGGGNGDLPDFEVGLRYHANGIAEDILQDFGTFSLRGTLSDVRGTDRQGC